MPLLRHAGLPIGDVNTGLPDPSKKLSLKSSPLQYRDSFSETK
ncbi:MAG: hypothetical protein JWL59_835 [Chthoniobacteraceae bacterium]|nr:hypothetical protein [Chthoniobacteraceae bacterium]